jgi:FixJ family two-component response regulator
MDQGTGLRARAAERATMVAAFCVALLTPSAAASRDGEDGGSGVVATACERYARLTPIERTVCQMLAEGRDERAIADALAIDLIAAEFYRCKVFRKMEVAELMDLVLLTRACGVV